LKLRTVAFYEALLEQKIYPELGDVPLKDITPHVVRNWYNTLDAEHPTRRAHAYTPLKTASSLVLSTKTRTISPAPLTTASNAAPKRQQGQRRHFGTAPHG
jgi:Phage integrase, N-terminal SAM-like domain